MPTGIVSLSPGEWQEIEKAAIGGASYKDLSAAYGVEETAIRVRASRNKWAIPSRVRDLANRMLEEQDALVTAKSNRSNEAPKSGELLASTLLRNGEQSSLIGSNLLLGLLQKATLEKLQPLEHVGDVLTAIKGARLTGGMDKSTTEVKVNLAMFAGQGESEEWVEVEQSQ